MARDCLTSAVWSTGQDHEMCKRAVEAWSKKNGHKTKIVTVPSSSTEVLALFQQLLAAKSNDIDVFNVDVIWPGILGQHFVDLAPYTKGVEKQHFPSIIANNTVGGRLVAMPFTTDAGVLYYCKDLLEKHGASVPTTWDELTTTALAIQKAERAEGNPKLWGYVWQGKAYEGLTCNALEWIASHGGGTIIDADGKVTVNNEGDVKAPTRAAGWVDRISPPGVLNYAEEEARGVFQSGNAVFMRNWPCVDKPRRAACDRLVNHTAAARWRKARARFVRPHLQVHNSGTTAGQAAQKEILSVLHIKTRFQIRNRIF